MKVELEKVNRYRETKVKTRSLWVTQKGSSKRIQLDKIVYIEVVHHDVIIHTLNDEIKFRGSLTAIEEKMDKSSFVRIGSSFIVNLMYVEGVVKGQCKLQGDIFLPISRSNKSEFMDKLNSYLNYDLEL